MVKPPNRTLLRSEPKILHEDLINPDPAETQEVSSLALSDKLGTIMPQLDDIESSYSKPEKSLPLDLGLDQIEDYQE